MQHADGLLDGAHLIGIGCGVLLVEMLDHADAQALQARVFKSVRQSLSGFTRTGQTERETNFQSTGDGDGYLRLFTFDTASRAVTVTTYSPYLHRSISDAADAFTYQPY